MQTLADMHAGRIGPLANATVLAIFILIAAWFVGSLLRRSAASRGVALTGAIAVFTVAYNPTIPSESIRDAAVYFSVALLTAAALVTPGCRTRWLPILLTCTWYATFVGVTYSLAPGNVGLLLKFGVVSSLVVVVAARSGRRDRGHIFKGIIVLASLHVLAGMTELLTASPFIWGYDTLANGLPAVYPNPFTGASLMRIQSSLGHPLPLGVLISVALVLLVANRRIYRHSRSIPVGLLLATGLFFNGSRSAVLALLAGALYVLLFSHKNRSRIRNAVVVLVASLSLAIFDFGISSLVGDFVDSGSFTNRLGALESVPGLVGRSPGDAVWGSGFGTEPSLFAQGLLQQNGFGIVDNQFVTTLATFGIFGIVFLLAILARTFFRSDSAGRSVLIVLIAMMFSFDYLRWPETFMLLFAVIGLSGVYLDRFQNSRPQGSVANSRVHSEVSAPLI